MTTTSILLTTIAVLLTLLALACYNNLILARANRDAQDAIDDWRIVSSVTVEDNRALVAENAYLKAKQRVIHMAWCMRKRKMTASVQWRVKWVGEPQP